jgi:hypothetical protein
MGFDVLEAVVRKSTSALKTGGDIFLRRVG